jgi:hypothetical protein
MSSAPYKNSFGTFDKSEIKVSVRIIENVGANRKYISLKKQKGKNLTGWQKNRTADQIKKMRLSCFFRVRRRCNQK